MSINMRRNVNEELKSLVVIANKRFFTTFELNNRPGCEDVQGAANKSNPLRCFVNISTTNGNFYKKIYTLFLIHIYL